MRSSLTVSCILGGLAMAGTAVATPIGGASVTASVLYGVDTTEADPGINGFGVGLAAEAGVTLPGSLYLGVSAEHFFGETQGESLLSLPGIDIERSASITELMGHLGYDWSVGGVVLRPSLGAGLALLDVDIESVTAGETTSSSTSKGGVVLSPAAEARIPVGGIVSACVELRYDIVVLSDAPDLTGFVIGAGVGLDL
jgi:hypothetical protein